MFLCVIYHILDVIMLYKSNNIKSKQFNKDSASKIRAKLLFFAMIEYERYLMKSNECKMQ